MLEILIPGVLRITAPAGRAAKIVAALGRAGVFFVARMLP